MSTALFWHLAEGNGVWWRGEKKTAIRNFITPMISLGIRKKAICSGKFQMIAIVET